MIALIGKVYEKIDDNHGYIIGEDNNLYFFTSFDIIDDSTIIKGLKVEFKPKKDIILKATYISKFEE